MTEPVWSAPNIGNTIPDSVEPPVWRRVLDEPLVSIVCLVHTTGPYFAECLDGALGLRVSEWVKSLQGTVQGIGS